MATAHGNAMLAAAEKASVVDRLSTAVSGRGDAALRSNREGEPWRDNQEHVSKQNLGAFSRDSSVLDVPQAKCLQASRGRGPHAAGGGIRAHLLEEFATDDISVRKIRHAEQGLPFV